MTPIRQRKVSCHARKNSLSLIWPLGLRGTMPTPHNPRRGHPIMTRELTEDLLRPLTKRTVKAALSNGWIIPDEENSVVLACGVDSASARVCPHA